MWKSLGVAVFLFLGVIYAQDELIDPACSSVTDCVAFQECQCPTSLPPAPYISSEIPQLIILSFDDAITNDLYTEFYEKLFLDARVNPNGCPIRGTFFIQHDYTNYSLVHDLWRNGFEIASHSMTHQVPAESWAELTLEEYTAEMVGVRLAAEQYAKIPSGEITGIRAPFLRMNGNNYTKMMQESGFLYDASRPTRQQMDTGLWPYTYDFVYAENLFLDCPIPPCPGSDGEVFPGVWQIPINDLTDTEGIECAMLDQCNGRPDTLEEALDLLEMNFQRHYQGSRTPFNLFTHASWFQGTWTHNFDALKQWLDAVLALGDVYVVPARMAIEFLRNPVDSVTASLGIGVPFDCSGLPIQQRDCRVVNNCDYCDPNRGTEGASSRLPAEVIMPVCGNCPPCFPTPYDPLGLTCVGPDVYPRCEP